MFWKKSDDTQKKLAQMNDILKKSFSNVKRDTGNIFQWLNYFYKKNMEQEAAIKRLQLELSYIPKTREDIRKIIDDYYSFETIMGKIRDIDRKVEELSIRPQQIERVLEIQKESPDMFLIEKRLERLEHRKLSIKEKIIKRLTKNSKEYVKSVMLSYIRKYEKISALELKDMMVDEQHFCSKSSFYRLLEELEELDGIGVIKQGKEKHYLAKSLRKI